MPGGCLGKSSLSGSKHRFDLPWKALGGDGFGGDEPGVGVGSV